MQMREEKKTKLLPIIINRGCLASAGQPTAPGFFSYNFDLHLLNSRIVFPQLILLRLFSTQEYAIFVM